MDKCGCSSSGSSITENFTANGKSFNLVEKQNNDGFSMYVTDESSKTISPIYSVNFDGVCSCNEAKYSDLLKDLKSSLKQTTISNTQKWFSKI